MVEINNAPPRYIPPHLFKDYTLGGLIKVEDWYRDDRVPSDKPTFYSKNVIDENIRKVILGLAFYYGATDHYLYDALRKFPIEGKRVAIMGSSLPVYESICLAYGGKPKTIEYNKIVSDDPRLSFSKPSEFQKEPFEVDAAFSISSFEHDGLGRYGDPLNFNGDLDAMQNMKKILKKDGFLFLSIPIGKDKLVWNVHRIYGRLRLPMLLENWKVVDTFGYIDEQLNFDTGKEGGHQPVFILQNV